MSPKCRSWGGYQVNVLRWGYHCRPTSAANSTHCAPPTKVLPNRSAKVSTVFRSGVCTKGSRRRSSKVETTWYRVLEEAAMKAPHQMLLSSTGARCFSPTRPDANSCFSTKYLVAPWPTMEAANPMAPNCRPRYRNVTSLCCTGNCPRCNAKPGRFPAHFDIADNGLPLNETLGLSSHTIATSPTTSNARSDSTKLISLKNLSPRCLYSAEVLADKPMASSMNSTSRNRGFPSTRFLKAGDNLARAPSSGIFTSASHLRRISADRVPFANAACMSAGRLEGPIPAFAKMASTSWSADCSASSSSSSPPVRSLPVGNVVPPPAPPVAVTGSVHGCLWESLCKRRTGVTAVILDNETKRRDLCTGLGWRSALQETRSDLGTLVPRTPSIPTLRFARDKLYQ
mmetsp:Transcript_6379/g.18368  ORF Transcript_6379/g.18368 Transcript_6379/m.18368 type:complete len:399 (+) Transcript_6379:706-1902(+)